LKKEGDYTVLKFKYYLSNKFNMKPKIAPSFKRRAACPTRGVELKIPYLHTTKITL